MKKARQISSPIPHIVIVGGGAGGSELAALLGKKLGKPGKAAITLVDATLTHLWKPLLHEIASGTMNSYEDEINYFALARNNHFQFAPGTLQTINRAKKEIVLTPTSSPHEDESIPTRTVKYDVLMIAVGSVANDFGTPGVRDHCLFLDNLQQANAFHQHLLKTLINYGNQAIKKRFNITVIGGGATGIELIAELHNAVRLMANYGLQFDPAQIDFTLVEAADRLLPALSPHLSKLVLTELQRLNVQVHLSEKVIAATELGLETQSGEFIASDLMIWTAGIKAPDFLQHLDGLETNRANQLLVRPTLQTTLDDAIFAFGDCASCPQLNSEKPVPPRAQAAHQQAQLLVKSLACYFKHTPLPNFHYRDHGSLITISHYEVVGNLMGKIVKSWHIEGGLARLFYLSLYKQHQTALYGLWRVILLTLANRLSRKVKPRLKLH